MTPPHVASNPWEEKARLKKAVTLANFINATFADVLDEDFLGLADMPETWWMAVAKRAGVNVPSDRCVAQVISLLRQQGLSRPASDAGAPVDSPPSAGASGNVRELYREHYGAAR